VLKRALPAAAIAAILWGCAQLTPMPSGGPEAGGFELSGRVAIRYGEESATGRVQWRHSEDSDDLLLTNPLGQGVARVTRSGNQVELENSDGRKHLAADAESLTEEVLGWRLPLKGLPDWVRGRPRPGSPAAVVRDAQQRVAELRQDGWRVEYEEYAEERPARLRLTRPDMEMRLVIDSWQASAS
jgi:outer membrane lipoprotein LolB